MNNPIIKPGIVTLVIQWIARVWSMASVGLVLLIAVGELVYPHAPPPSTFRDLVGLFLFPFGVCVGMIVAWRWEGLGGGITVGSFSFLCDVACYGWPVSAWAVVCTHSSARNVIPGVLVVIAG